VPLLQVPPGVEGLLTLTELPDDDFVDRWERIRVDEALKRRLANYMAFALQHRGRVSSVRLPVHGLVVLHGPPGTGKTTLAMGLADHTARRLAQSTLLVHVDPTAFPSQLLGESQRSVARLMGRTIPDIARRGMPLVVLIDEVESLTVSRARASLDTNPVDVHRATDAALAGMDAVAAACPNVVFVATTNYPAGVDTAFLSRADIQEAIALPNGEACAWIAGDTLDALGATIAAGDLAALGEACAERGMDARQIRKLVLRAVIEDDALVHEPHRVTAEQVRRAMDS
jgi:AAA+ superfamily predicted ATPase